MTVIAYSGGNTSPSERSDFQSETSGKSHAHRRETSEDASSRGHQRCDLKIGHYQGSPACFAKNHLRCAFPNLFLCGKRKRPASGHNIANSPPCSRTAAARQPAAERQRKAAQGEPLLLINPGTPQPKWRPFSCCHNRPG